jgi:hypothetical protein
MHFIAQIMECSPGWLQAEHDREAVGIFFNHECTKEHEWECWQKNAGQKDGLWGFEQSRLNRIGILASSKKGGLNF